MSVDTATETDDAITGMFLINSLPARVLFDCGANRSFMSVTLCDKLKLPINVLSEHLRIEVGDGRTVPITTSVSGVTIEIDGNEFPMTCLIMPIPIFDVVLGLDWLGRHKAKKKSVSDIPIVSEFLEVFPDELSGLPTVREVEYKIELLPGSTPVAKAPYRLAPFEIRDMMSQIHELLDRGFIQPSSLPWGAPVLLSPSSSSRGRYSKESFSYKIRSLRVFSYAVRVDKCASNIHGFNESGVQTVSRQIRDSIYR
ncbi:uncharacterized protein [Rutidosis leptorrhynchoides]|uniref:uncharacterized protein n=1 Tax=Rutidosis leptorrhynchoides TaxID=125765 RepID=UPI003A9A5D3C